ncbi:MAG TPA: hypothetical protein VJB94_04180 [Candidatus Nanoarchaeia archaeon]|nr:hypothetical protein [Candidatus Nanoarchaeia archaeon]
MDEEDCYSESYSKELLIPNGPSFRVWYSAWTPPLLMYQKNSDIELFLRLGDKEIVIFDGKKIFFEEALGKIKGYIPKPYNLIKKSSNLDNLLNKI